METVLSPKEVNYRATAAQSLREPWKPVLQDAYELAMPLRNPYSGNNKNPRSMERMYESTAMQSSFRAAGRMQMELTPPDQQWFDLKAGPFLEMQYPPAVIEQLEKTLAQHVNLMSVIFQSGSFVSAIWEAYLDLIVAGMGVMLVLENPSDDVEPILFEAVSQHEVTIEEGVGGRITGIYRTPSMKARMIERKWTDAKIPDDLQKIAKKEKDDEVQLLEVTYEDPKNTAEPWVYEVYWKNKDKDPERLVQRRYTTNPWIVFRWSKVPGSPYGPGPVMLSLPDIRTANTIMEMNLKNAALALAGMYLVADDGVVNPDNIVITQGGMIPVARTAGTLGASVVPLETGRDFRLGFELLEDLRVMIKKSLFDNALPPMEGGIRSATEIVQRMRELTQDIGGTIGRLTNELIVPLVRRVADILMKRGLMPPLKIDQYMLKVQVTSPLARVQQMQDVERVVQWLEMVIQLGGQEAALISAKMEEVFAWIADQIGVPAELVRDEGERREIQEQMATIAVGQAAPPAMPA